MTTPDASQGTAVIYITNAQPCSAGTGPGYATVPWAEARALVDQGFAVFGDQPPLGAEGTHGPVRPS